ncbi:MAG: FAD binding domain-containing protein [Oscillochloridaceae bacterium umkhey_bin13]
MHWQTYFQPTTLADALTLLAEHPQARPVVGGTDLVVELERGLRPTTTLVDLSRITELHGMVVEDDQLVLGALVTHNDLIADAGAVARALPLAQACLEVGAPQIRARGTIVGNLVTASPANDTITPLIAMDATLVLVSQHGERTIRLAEFYQGVRRTVLTPGELVRAVRVPLLRPNQRGVFLKLGLRRAQAIAVVNVAVVLTFATEERAAPITAAQIALGCVAPTIVRASAAEAALVSQRLDAATITVAAQAAEAAITPIDDVRGSAAYRSKSVSALVTRALTMLADGTEAANWPVAPVLLRTPVSSPSVRAGDTTALTDVQATVNGTVVQLSPRKTLLDALRDDAGLTGTKEGCGEGECGACTVWLDGQAVMACLTPAAQAHGREVTTIEGLAATRPLAQVEADGPALHPLQASFIREAAVQCGYCIPGMLMAGAKLLDEYPQPDLAQIQQALSGNLCRCTGYRKIIAAVQAAVESDNPMTPPPLSPGPGRH